MRIALLTGLAVLALPLGAQRPNQPSYFAIRNARLVTVSGPVIENGTIVLERGLIAAIGTNVTIPPEAWVVEGKGLTVYPGLIDSLTTLGLQDATTGAQPAGLEASPFGQRQQQTQQQQQQRARGPEDRPSTTTWENAADRLQTADRRIETWRKAGFTSAVTSPDRGIFPGQAALINLAGERASEMVVKTPVALRINLSAGGGFGGGGGGGGGGFPGSLMGVIAYVRQVFLDADQYGRALAIYEAQPGHERPTYDRTLDPIRQTIAARRPVLIPASSAKDIRRMVELSREWGVQPLFYGGHQAYDAVDALAARKTPVLVSLRWPEKVRDADPDQEDSLRTLRLRDRAPSAPAALDRAGVPFAFYSDGIANPADILKNARRAVDAGLSRERALRALTLSAAEIYGASNRLGSLEAGKIANLTVTDGDLFAERTKTKMVFVDGAKFEVREASRPTAPPTVKVTGKWTLTLNSPQGAQESTADLTMAEDGTLTGTLAGTRGSASISSGWVSDNKFSFTVTQSLGPRSTEVTYTGTVEGDRMRGSVGMGPATIEFTATRSAGGQ